MLLIESMTFTFFITILSASKFMTSNIAQRIFYAHSSEGAVCLDKQAVPGEAVPSLMPF